MGGFITRRAKQEATPAIAKKILQVPAMFVCLFIFLASFRHRQTDLSQQNSISLNKRSRRCLDISTGCAPTRRTSRLFKPTSLYTNFLFSVLIRFHNAEPSAAAFHDLCKIHFSLLCCMLLFRKKSLGIIASKEVTYFIQAASL